MSHSRIALEIESRSVPLSNPSSTQNASDEKAPLACTSRNPQGPIAARRPYACMCRLRPACKRRPPRVLPPWPGNGRTRGGLLVHADVSRRVYARGRRAAMWPGSLTARAKAGFLAGSVIRPRWGFRRNARGLSAVTHGGDGMIRCREQEAKGRCGRERKEQSEPQCLSGLAATVR